MHVRTSQARNQRPEQGAAASLLPQLSRHASATAQLTLPTRHTPIQLALSDGATGAHRFADLRVYPEPSAALGPGAPLPGPTRARMERVLGASFSAVRVHEGSHVARLGAVAYTHGETVHFASGRYRPGSPAGDRLLGHELVHVAQQRAGRVRSGEYDQSAARVVTDSGLEAEADAWGDRVASGEPLPVPGLHGLSAPARSFPAIGTPISDPGGVRQGQEPR